MKKFISHIFVGLLVVTVAVSCKKDYSRVNTTYPDPTPVSERRIRYQLYTNHDFSDNNSMITFSLFIRNANRTLLDSPLVSMKIKDIPDAAHKLIFEKTVTGDNSDLAAGFRYEIQNVGNSWFTDTSKAGNVYKVIDYAFQ
ncbi:MAG TPA: hypothetical protein VGQ09_12550 [Chitinophagaceae bacterium]|jgi:hypothetical protein|nr:hypothetical protein [Chitinophagaceae bacterium]